MGEKDTGMIPVTVDQLFLSNMGFVVLLKGTDDPRTLPIFIGAPEAQAIAIRINGADVPRPLTHDLMKNLLDLLECRLIRVEVCGLKEGTFFANLIVDRDGAETPIDARPSDAIALALRFSAPIVVAAAVMNEAGKIMDKPEGAASPGKKVHKELSPLEKLQQQQDRAVAEERYEEAARLRDEIERFKSTHTKN